LIKKSNKRTQPRDAENSLHRNGQNPPPVKVVHPAKIYPHKIVIPVTPFRLTVSGLRNGEILPKGKLVFWGIMKYIS
jgi:hypothetical protein